MDEIAAVLTTPLGRPVRFQNETVEDAWRSRAVYRAPNWEVEAWVSTYAAIAAGELATATDDVQALTGHAPATLAECLAR